MRHSAVTLLSGVLDAASVLLKALNGAVGALADAEASLPPATASRTRGLLRCAAGIHSAISPVLACLRVQSPVPDSMAARGCCCHS